MQCEERGVLLERGRVRLFQLLAMSDSYCRSAYAHARQLQHQLDNLRPAVETMHRWAERVQEARDRVLCAQGSYCCRHHVSARRCQLTALCTHTPNPGR